MFPLQNRCDGLIDVRAALYIRNFVPIFFLEKSVPCTPDVTFVVYYVDIHDFERSIINVLTWYSNTVLENQIITSISATFIDKRNHDITPYLLESKWGMGLKI